MFACFLGAAAIGLAVAALTRSQPARLERQFRTLAQRQTELDQRVADSEGRMEAARREVTMLATDIGDYLDDAKQKLARARAAEQRVRKRQGENGAPNDEPADFPTAAARSGLTQI